MSYRQHAAVCCVHGPPLVYRILGEDQGALEDGASRTKCLDMLRQAESLFHTKGAGECFSTRILGMRTAPFSTFPYS